MPLPSERLAGWLSPKWLVVAVAFAADGMLLNYDLRLGLAGAAVLAVIALMWLYIALRYGSLSGARSVRTNLVEGARKQENLRRMAALRSGAQESADPAERP